MAEEKYTKEEAVQILEVGKAKMDAAQTKDEVLVILKEVGAEVAYTPTFRCLVMGQKPEESIKWR